MGHSRSAALLGAYSAQLGFGLPSIGGKDSMSGSFYDEEHGEIDVPPTLVSFAVDVADTKHVVSPEFKKAGSKIVLFDHRERCTMTCRYYSQIMDGYEKIHEDIKAGRSYLPHMRLRMLVWQRLSARWPLETAWA